MLRRTRTFVFATCLTACGSFLGLGGSDEGESPGTNDDDGGGGTFLDATGESTVSIIDDDGGTDPGGGSDAATGPDVRKDSAPDLDGGPTNPNACNGKQSCERYVFVTSAAYPGDFDAATANDKCRERADANTSLAALNGRVWRAWISTSARSALTNLEVYGTARYKRVDGETIADSFALLNDGDLDVPIDQTETGATVMNGLVWTATSTNGSYVAAGCNGFTAAANGFAKVGDTGAKDGSWTNAGDHSCLSEARLYCFEY